MSLHHDLLACVDLTNLNEDCTKADIDALCAKATTDHGKVAAICIWPQFIAHAKPQLVGTGVKIATVVNFPDGGEDTLAAEDLTAKAVADGTDEIDMVMAYRAFAEGRPGFAETQMVRIKRVCGDALLKVILETGELQHANLITGASELALEAGADFIKTSTGKVPVNATEEAAELMLSVLAKSDQPKGFKAAGGIRTADEAVAYFQIAQRIRADERPDPATFRIGASSLLDALVAAIEGRTAETGAGY